MMAGDGRSTSPSFARDLLAQVFSDKSHIDAGRYCAYNGFLGVIILGAAIVLEVSGSPPALGIWGVALVALSGMALMTALVMPLAWPGRVPKLLAVHGALVLVLTAAFAISCARWALLASPRPSFRYLPGLIVVGVTYGTAQWAEIRSHGRRAWRFRGFVAGVVAETVVAALVLFAALRP